jgi:hypothetical protein
MYGFDAQHSGHTLQLQGPVGPLVATNFTFVAKDSIVTAVAVSDTAVYLGCMDHHIYALSPTMGTVMWSLALPTGIESSPVRCGVACRVVSDAVSRGPCPAVAALCRGAGVACAMCTTTPIAWLCSPAVVRVLGTGPSGVESRRQHAVRRVRWADGQHHFTACCETTRRVLTRGVFL